MSVTGEPGGEPVKAGVALLDVVTGLQATIGILAAIAERERTGRGRHVGVALFDASVAAMVNQAANTLIGGMVPEALGTAHPNIVPYQAFHASDRPFILAVRQRPAVRAHLRGRRPPRLGHRRSVRARIEARVEHRYRARSRCSRRSSARGRPATWLAALEAASVPCSPIRTMDELFDSPEGSALVAEVDDPARDGTLRLVVNPLVFDGERLPTRLPPPALGADTEQVLGER